MSSADTIPNMLDRLNNNKEDGIVINIDSAQAYMKTHTNLMVVDFPDVEGVKLDFNCICVVLRKKDRELLKNVNEALSAITTETRQKLMVQATAKVGRS